MAKAIHPDKADWIKSGDEDINQILPDLSPQEKSYLELITDESYSKLVEKVQRYIGVEITDRNLPSLVAMLFAAVQKVKILEASHKKTLEELALTTVLELPEFKIVQEAYTNDEVSFKIELGQPTAADFKLDDKPEEKGELSEMEKLNQQLADMFGDKDISSDKVRRRFANLLITGGAFSKMYLFHMVDQKLTRINDQLPKLYGALGVLAELGYWLTPDGVEETAARNPQQAAGVEQVVPDGDKYIIKAKAVSFPYLMHEIVKGIYEWISLDPDTQKLLGKEKLEHETRDVLAGPELFKKIAAMVPGNKQGYMPLVQKKLIALEPSDIKEILAQSDKGKKKFSDLLKQSEDEWEEYKKDKNEYNQ